MIAAATVAWSALQNFVLEKMPYVVAVIGEFPGTSSLLSESFSHLVPGIKVEILDNSHLLFKEFADLNRSKAEFCSLDFRVNFSAYKRFIQVILFS